MSTYLYRHDVDPEDFPEMERSPGDYRVEAAWVPATGDRRLPLPAGARAVMFVSSTLRAGQVPRGARWVLRVERAGAEGKRERRDWLLLEMPSGRDNAARPVPAPAQLPPGLVLRDVYWVDLDPLLAEGALRAGDQLTVSFGPAEARLSWPPGR